MQFSAKFAKSFAIFRDRNYSVYFFGQFISRIGNSVNLLALMWLAHVLTDHSPDSTFLMSLVLASSVVPRVVLAPLTGVLVDRWPKRKALIVTDISRFILVAALTAMAYTDTASVTVLVVFSVLMSVFSTVTMSAFRVVQKHIVAEDQLLQSNSLFQTSLNIAQIAGPAIAGGLIGWFGVGTAFAIDAATFAVSFITLMRSSVNEPTVTKRPLTGFAILRDMQAGAKVALGISQLRLLLPLMLAFNFFVCAVENLLIIQYVANVLGRGAGTVGVIDSSMSVGALVGSLALSAVVGKWGRGRLLVINMVISALTIAATGITPYVWLICVYFFIAGFCMTIVNVVFWTDIQASVPSEHLGAVFGMLGSVFEGAVPLSQLLFGGIALLLPVGAVLGGMGVLAALAGVAFLLSPSVRQPGSTKETPVPSS